ncbi:MAG: hypothetical protein QGI86_13370 [Candidatus Poribacteria bacterium]|nr:hypothetical protein [Candidatus Poribacteria bacterium]MDP6747383.1 hypothetical protein [Candidatus Poribacteria bacterium]MDP6962032.1 hypothetical protein [Dehalococcoidia bacterium]
MKDTSHDVGSHESLDFQGENIPAELIAGRQERPRSLVDLIELDTVGIELAAWLMSHISRGASLIVGSGPGGIGKTTTMRALLGFAPGSRPFVIALPEKISGINSVPSCVISHEVSEHRVPTYLWDQDLRDFFALSQQGHMLVSNMHANHIDEVHSQIVATNGVPEDQFRAVNLFVFIWIEGGDPSVGRIKDSSSRRFISEVFYSDGTAKHKSIFTPEQGLSAQVPRDAAYEKLCRTFLEEELNGLSPDIQEVRNRFLEWEKQHK